MWALSRISHKCQLSSLSLLISLHLSKNYVVAKYSTQTWKRCQMSIRATEKKFKAFLNKTETFSSLFQQSIKAFEEKSSTLTIKLRWWLQYSSSFWKTSEIMSLMSLDSMISLKSSVFLYTLILHQDFLLSSWIKRSTESQKSSTISIWMHH